MAVACVWSTAGVPQEATAGILLGGKKFLRALRAGTGRSRQSQGPSRPSWRPCWDSVLSLLGLQVRLVGPTWWSFEDPRALQPPWAVVRGCFCRVSGQCGAPRWPQISLGSVCSRFTQRWQEHHPPRAGLQVCVPRGGAQCRGWAQAWVARWARRGPQGGADYLLVSQVANAEERVLLPGAVFS